MTTEDPTTNTTGGLPSSEPTGVERYEIRVSGRLSPRWATWFDGLTVTDGDDGTTLISGAVVDQAALHGLLQRLRDLGLTLLSLARVPPREVVEHPISPTNPTRTTTPGATS